MLGVLQPGHERNEHTNKAAPETSDNLQPAGWMTERTSFWIRQLRMIDLCIGKLNFSSGLAIKSDTSCSSFLRHCLIETMDH